METHRLDVYFTDRMLVMDDISELNSTIWFLKYGVGHGFKKESN